MNVALSPLAPLEGVEKRGGDGSGGGGGDGGGSGVSPALRENYRSLTFCFRRDGCCSSELLEAMNYPSRYNIKVGL